MPDKPILEKKFNEDLDVEKKLREGAVLARLFIELQGNDKEAAEKALKRTIFDSLASEKNTYLLYVKLYEVKELAEEEKAYSGVVEVKALFPNFRWFVNTIFRYGPSAIEVISPESYKLELEEIQALIADVSGFSQSFSTQIMSMLKDTERRKLYQEMLKKSQSTTPP